MTSCESLLNEKEELELRYDDEDLTKPAFRSYENVLSTKFANLDKFVTKFLDGDLEKNAYKESSEELQQLLTRLNEIAMKNNKDIFLTGLCRMENQINELRRQVVKIKDDMTTYNPKLPKETFDADKQYYEIKTILKRFHSFTESAIHNLEKNHTLLLG